MLELKESFGKEVENLKDFLILVTVDAKSYNKSVADIMRIFASGRIPGVYVTLNKPCDIIRRNLENAGIATGLVIFIDAISRTENIRKADKCLYIGNPEKLSDISVAMEQAITALPTDEKFLVFDSLNTLAIFNKPATVARFTHFLASKMREWKVKGVMLTLGNETDQALLDELTQFSDARIDLGGA